MRHSLLSRCTAIFLIASFTLSCATTKVPPISATGSGFTPERDEVKLWEQARAEEKKLRAEAKIYNDPLLEDYLDGVVTTLNPKKMAANEKIDYHVTVIEDPTLNAFAYPHGSLYVHTGLLARMENEDQLATVLGHEMTHVENRHMLRYQRSARNKQIAAFAGAVAGSIILEKQAADASRSGHTGRAAATRVLSGVMLGLGLQLGLLAAVNGYGRDLEREADVGGFEKMSSVGYDLREAPKVYEALLDDHGDPSKAEAFFFGNHPRLTERIDTAKEWRKTHPQAAAAPGGAADRDPEQFQKRVRGVVRDDARLNIEMGRLELAESELARASKMLPEDPEVQYLTGRLKLEKAKKAKDKLIVDKLNRDAAAAFREAVRLDPSRPGPHRELGLLAYRSGDGATACTEFRKYLELAPSADDAQSLRDYLTELKRDGKCP